MTGHRVVVIGGGISGLTVAFSLRQAADAAGLDLDLTVLDADRAGGHAHTITDSGFIVEAGPNGFLDREAETMNLVRALGLESRIVVARPEAKRRFIVRGGRLRQVPDSPPSLLRSDAISLRGKLRLLREPFASAAEADVDESVYDFAVRRIGPEAALMLVDAAVAGISAGDSRQLSVRSQFPLMVEMEREHGSLIRAMIARRRSGKQPAELKSFDGGMATMVNALAARLGQSLRPHARVQSVLRIGREWRIVLENGERIDADRLILATPARASASIVRSFDSELSAALEAIPFSSVALAAFAYRASDIPRALDGYGYLVTRPENLATLGVVWESSLFPGRAPEGSALLRVVLGGARRPEIAALEPGEIAAIARDELRKVMEITAEPARTWCFRWPQAIAQYTIGHSDRMEAIRNRVSRYDTFEFCGTSFDGISFNQAVAAGMKLGRTLASTLRVPQVAAV